jgi:hypothetical protein
MAGAFSRALEPEALLHLDSIEELAHLKDIKDRVVCTGVCLSKNTHKYSCRKCTQVRKSLCRRYHNLPSPKEELVARLVYEYMFDVLTLCDIATGNWMDHSIRDIGHHTRMTKLIRQVGVNSVACSWLPKPRGFY